MTINHLGGRKFLLTAGCGIVTSFLTWFGKIDGATYSLVVLGTIGAFITGNVMQAVKAPKSE